ncbi:MAG: FecR domain-containing protein, partial [Deltaproteobacteria bacterium]|nr:FecR domain-containing protein [Candidatus Zymogenus saltonus]
TDSESSVELKLADGSVIKIGEESHVIIKEFSQVEVTKVSRSKFELIKGKVRAVVKPLIGKESRFTIESDNVTLGVRSTDFGMIFDPDLGNTNVISVEGCVSILAKNFPSLDALEVCTMEELLVSGSDSPGSVKKVDVEKLKEFLEEMGFKGEEGTSGSEEILPPEITSAILNNRINLEDMEDVLTLTKSDLGVDGKISIAGTAEDGKYGITKVEVTTDGGMTWSAAGGADRWTFAFKPEADMEYELMMRATNEKDVVSDPEDFGSFTVKYTDVSYEEIAKEFIDNFFRYVKSSNTTGLGDLISDSYDGKAASLFTKDELLDDNLEEFFDTNQDFTISYSINQVSYDGKSVIVSTSWNASIGGVSSSGTTKWWLSQSDNYTLIHTEGKWFTDEYMYIGTPELVVTLRSTGIPACPDGVRIMLVAPKVPASQDSVIVDIEVYCDIPKEVTLTRSFYEKETGKKGGFGGDFYVYDTGSPTCTAVPPQVVPYEPFLYYGGADKSLGVSYSDYGYSFFETIMMP